MSSRWLTLHSVVKFVENQFDAVYYYFSQVIDESSGAIFEVAVEIREIVKNLTIKDEILLVI